MDVFHNRYQLEQPWKQADGGEFAAAKDLKLGRSVLLWRTTVREDKQRETILRRLGNAARFGDRRFVHILDVAVAGEDLYAVLTRDHGAWLTDRLRELDWNGAEILEQLKALCPVIREARRERLQDYAVTADNLWLDGEGRLQIVNGWTESAADRRDVRGLSVLLYQLCARTEELPSSMPQFQQALARTLTGLPGGSSEEAAEWASSAFLPSCTLRDYESRLARLLEPLTPAEPAPGASAAAAAQRKKGPADRRQKGPNPAETRPRQSAGVTGAAGSASMGARLRPWIIFSAVVFGIGMLGVLGLWYATRMPAGGREAIAQPSESAAPTSAAGERTGAAGASRPPAGSPLPSPALSPSPTPVKPAGSPSAQPSHASKPPPEQAAVPNLVNLTLEEASKAALAAGLKYQYQLEPNDLAQGLVFKQDPQAGATAAKGDRVVFWVSKGK